MKNIYCIVGRSGSGKDTLVDNLLKAYPEWKKLISKTTRPKRSDTENCHEFTTPEEYEKDLKMGIVLAHNVYNGNHYWATVPQVEAADLYIIDIPGLIELRKKYKGNKEIKAIGLYISKEESAKRMVLRGDKPTAIAERLKIDDEAFKDLPEKVDFCVNTNWRSKEEVFNAVVDYLKM